MIGKNNLFNGILIVCVVLLFVALFQTSSVLLFSVEYTCDDLIGYPPYEPCWGAQVMDCIDDPEWYSLCKLKCWVGGDERRLYCNPYE